MPTPPTNVEHPAEDEQQALTDDTLVRREVQRLVRASNLAIFVVFLAGLACVAFVQTTRFFSDRTEVRGWLVGLRLILPLLALFLTAIVTKRVLARFVNRVGDVDLALVDYVPAFAACKAASVAFLTLAGLFASICLLFSHKTMDVLLAGLPIGLLFISRPTYFSLLGFVGTVQSMHDEAAKSQARGVKSDV